ncbi:AraC family transcriptional regulator [Malaciobacter mytili LMG 24559]|uniref:AraC family transcriptional regulator n=1 Tax=Malaciobacter mytili LMG 24559 TaxID=1032238 RepID=A0AAX2AKL4_9BACT|nr:AraC family transcriptional regulator [Malaciobacter mytili]AXH14749.1 transcriptional regulator, AraC family (GyrI domain) [Malaciobacter mytili LMG 24559]RXK16879.1 AraC family transcriptional regulator [Malaciobacter mytili LMG 24559]
MKKDTLQKRTKIANDIMYYIYTHIDTHIDIEELSFDLQISKFHMHRIFKEAFGKNIYESIKSIRLQKAANLLLTNRYSTISNIANSCGYSSQSSFIKAFKQRFEMSPKQWKNYGYKEYSNKILQQSQRALQSTADFSKLTPNIVKMPTQDSFYIRNKGYNVNVKETWQKLQTLILNNNLKEYKQIALLHDNPTITPLNECQYIACIVPKNKNDVKSDRLPSFKIEEGVYAKFDLKGKHGDMLKFIHWVYHEWLVKSEYETTTKPSFVVYNKNNFLSEDNEFDISFYVSIKF